MTPLKGRCTKGWGHVRDIHSPSRLPHFFLFEHSRQVGISVLTLCNVSGCDPKCEGNVRDFCSPSRPSNALYIRVWSLSCEYVRVKTTVKPNQERQIATRHISNRETTSYCSRNDLSLIEKRRVACCSWETKNRWFTKLWSTNLCTEKIIRTFAVLCEYS